LHITSRKVLAWAGQHSFVFACWKTILSYHYLFFFLSLSFSQLGKAKMQYRVLQNELSKYLGCPGPTILCTDTKPQTSAYLRLLPAHNLLELTQFHQSEFATPPDEHNTSPALQENT
jgi:hypothetical protein